MLCFSYGLVLITANVIVYDLFAEKLVIIFHSDKNTKKELVRPLNQLA